MITRAAWARPALVGTSVGRISRLPRIEIEGGIYHVVARGNERRAIFGDAADRERFLEILAQVARRYRVAVLAYCLLDNHYHLLLQTQNANLARAMRQLNGVYAQWFNRRHNRVGHLFQGRYGARLVQADEHLLAAVRYVVRNPLRAGMCRRLEDWHWSSHLQTLGERPPGLLALDRLLSFFAEGRAEARTRYLTLVASEDDPDLFAHPLAEGDDGFLATQLSLVRPDPEYPRRALRGPRPPLVELVRDASEASAIAHAYLEHGYSMRAIATHLGCGVATVHRRVRSVEARGETRKT
ncbi:MAG TPA: transposase [Gaiellaceae bacterium]|nr:transposase [Gaiellaceae bacterium]